MVKRFGVSMDVDLLNRFDLFIKKYGYKNRSEALREIIRERLIDETVKNEDDVSFGTIVIVYDHEIDEVNDKLVDLQHEYTGLIIFSTHIHVDRRNCIENIVVKGKNRDISSLAQRLRTVEGVSSVKLLLTNYTYM
ncbi:MAG: nickel-responsive transcriptional regulator NikR [Thermoplasmata archaeon]|jgi:CopG family nickel-responsive transcriptional regulator|nr:MAG: nickel-responsive transcriptional regulator NikR [Aciduliprofundum sp.]HEU12844.1 nickel-responsive transcriptional regulator NikR [Euryarchaeota archaeon]